MSDLSLPLPSDFNHESTLRYLDRSPMELLHQVDGETVSRLIEIQGAAPILCRMVLTDDQVQIECLNRSPKEAEKKYLVQYIEQWWDLKRDLSPFYSLAEGDPLLSQTLAGNRGLRMMGVPDLFEALCWSIVGQQVTLAFAYQLKKNLIEAFGNTYEWEGQQYWMFPRPEVIAEKEVEDLIPLKLIRRRCEYIIGIAQSVVEGKLDRSALLAVQSAKAAEKMLVAQRGIGPWSANYVMMRCLRYPDAYPTGDAGLQNAVKKLLQMDQKPTETELRELAIPWQGWEAYATFYLWAML